MGFFQFEIIFLIHLNTYVIGLRPLEIVLYRRQILTTKVDPRAISVKI